MTKGCSHFGHFARLPAFVRETLNEEPQLGQVTGAFMDLLTAKRHVHRAAANEFNFRINAARGSLWIGMCTPGTGVLPGSLPKQKHLCAKVFCTKDKCCLS